MPTSKKVTKKTKTPKGQVATKLPKPTPITLEIEPKFHKILGQERVKKALNVAAESNTPALLVGETGTGKTSLIRELAYKNNRKFSRFNMTGETTVDEFLGKYTLFNQDTIWQDGVLLQAMKEGWWLVVDEINMALPEVITLLHSLLDDDRFITVATHDGEIVRCHKDFRFFATMNPTDEYAGTKELNKAFFSRFGIVEEVKFPPKATEVNILKAQGTPQDVATQIVDTALTIRADKIQGRVYFTCSTRDLLHWAALVEPLGLQRGYELAILNKSLTDKEQLVKLYRTVNGEYEEYHKMAERMNISELLEKLKEMDWRETQLKHDEQKQNEIKVELQQELEKARNQEAKTREELRKEILDEVRSRLKTAVSYIEES